MALTKLQGQLLDTITSLTANNIIASNNITYSGTLTGVTGTYSGTVTANNIISSNNVTYSGTLTGSADVVNIGSGQIYKDANGNIGIGTSSPGYKLTVNGGNGNAIVYAGAANTAALGCIGAIPYVGSISNSSFLLLTNATVQGVLDTAGNFGLGVTPSAWTSATALQVQNTAIEGRVSNPSYGTFSANAFSQAGVWKYISSDYASRYTQYQANHYWYTAGTGTANNTITDFATAKMILDSSGNLGIGTTLTNASKVSIQNTAGNSTIGSSLSLLIGGKSGASVVGERQEIGFRSWYGYNTYTGSMAGIGIITTSTSSNELVDLYFYTAATGASLTPVERMRIDSSGNLGLGVTPSGWGTSGSAYKAFQYGVSGFLAGRTSNEIMCLGSGAYNDGTNWKYSLSGNYATLYQQSSGNHYWNTAGTGTAGNTFTFTQAMTLDTSGNLSVIGKLGVNGNSVGSHIHSYQLPGSLNGNYNYINLGTWTTSQNGLPMTMKIVTMGGYNADRSQDVWYEVYFKTSNAGSNASGFYADGYVVRHGFSSILSNLYVVQNSQSSYTFYAKFSSLIGNGSFYEINPGAGTWTHTVTDTGSTSAPAGTGSDIVTSSNYTAVDTYYLNNNNIDIGNGSRFNTAPTSGNAWFSTASYGVSQGDNRTHFGYNTGAGTYTNYIRGAATYMYGSTYINNNASVGGAGQISSGALSIFAGGASGVGWGTGLNIGDSSNYFGIIQDGGITRFRNYGTGGYDFRNSGGTTILALDNSGNMTVTGTITESSSIVLKENINPISNALNLINQLVGVTYDRKSTKKKEAGLIAEEVDKVIPDIVSRNGDGKPEGIQYTKLTAYLIEAVKELSKEIELLKNK